MRELMQQIYLAHQAASSAWQASKNRNYKPGKSHDRWTDDETAKMFRANGIAYRESQQEYDKLHALLNLFYSTFFHSQDIDEILDFLEIDIPAYRLGYQKEIFYRQLKTEILTSGQITRLSSIVCSLCAAPHYRREFRPAIGLMTKLADESFIGRILELADSDSEYAQRKAVRLLTTILSQRKDLELAIDDLAQDRIYQLQYELRLIGRKRLEERFQKLNR